MKTIIISAHPDDEVIGAGGTLLKHAQQKDDIYWIIVTNMSVDQGYDPKIINARQDEIEQVAKRLKMKGFFTLNYPTMSLSGESLLQLIPDISKIFMRIEPEIVYCLNRSDVHSDHRIVFDAVMACTKSFRYPFIKRVLMYECISETEFAPALHENAFIPNYFVDISDFLEEKLEIVNLYKSEIGEHPFPRSLENMKALATFRGASVGVKYAEAFQLLKYIDK